MKNIHFVAMGTVEAAEGRARNWSSTSMPQTDGLQPVAPSPTKAAAQVAEGQVPAVATPQSELGTMSKMVHNGIR
jgi:6-phosphogluconate dehydrogenase